jgi:hypothetical protein
MTLLEQILLGALIFTNWLWWIFFSAYHREIKKHLTSKKEKDI